MTLRVFVFASSSALDMEYRISGFFASYVPMLEVADLICVGEKTTYSFPFLITPSYLLCISLSIRYSLNLTGIVSRERLKRKYLAMPSFFLIINVASERFLGCTFFLVQPLNINRIVS